MPRKDSEQTEQNMRFPAWVDGPRKTKSQRASARLKYIINTLAAQHTDRGSIRALALRVGLDHSTISLYITAGKFTETAAVKIIAALACVPRDLKPSYLTDPLSIPTT